MFDARCEMMNQVMRVLWSNLKSVFNSEELRKNFHQKRKDPDGPWNVLSLLTPQLQS